jgi:hypothetical protein
MKVEVGHLLPPSALRGAFMSARKRAAASGMVFALTFDDIERMFSDQKGCCAISGLSFAPTRLPNAFVKHPFAPSLDRIDCTGGYTPGNVRLVCIAVNFGLGQWGEEVFRSIAEATVRNQPPPRTMPKAELDERISAAEAVLPLLNDVERVRQIRRIAGLKRARTLGVAGLSKAAIAAQRTRRANAMGRER